MSVFVGFVCVFVCLFVCLLVCLSYSLFGCLCDQTHFHPYRVALVSDLNIQKSRIGPKPFHSIIASVHLPDVQLRGDECTVIATVRYPSNGLQVRRPPCRAERRSTLH